MRRKITIVVLSFLFSLQSFSQSADWLWAIGMGSPNVHDVCEGLTTDAYGNIYATGAYRDTVDFDPGAGVFDLLGNGIFISKYDGSGNLIWAKAFQGGGSGYDIALDTLGNIYTTGFANGIVDFDPGLGVYNLAGGIFVSKLDSFGNFVWAKTMSGTNSAWGASIAVDEFENVYITGSFSGTTDFDPDSFAVFNINAYSNGTDVFISKLDSSGNFRWAKKIGGPTFFDWGFSLALDASLNVYTTGYFYGTVDFDPGPGIFNIVSSNDPRPFISKLDSAGNFIWAKAPQGGIGGFSYSIAVNNPGNNDVYYTGQYVGTVDFDPGPGVFNLSGSGVFISKLDSSGNFLWAKNAGGLTQELFLDPGGDGSVYIVGGFTGTVDFDPDTGVFYLTADTAGSIFISKSDINGHFLWAKLGAATGGYYFSSIAVDVIGNVIIGGDFRKPTASFGPSTIVNADTTTNFSDIFIAKLDTLSIPTGNNEIENSVSSFSLSPNPATNEITVHSEGFNVQRIEIFNVFGERCLTLTHPQPPLSGALAFAQRGLSIDVSSLVPGIYFVRLANEKEQVVRKVVVGR